LKHLASTFLLLSSSIYCRFLLPPNGATSAFVPTRMCGSLFRGLHLAVAVVVFVVVVSVIYVVEEEAQEGVSTQDMSHHLLSL
uniref:Essential MCU regulator, mitochondrial n=1 Tax=Taenia asiatica TaxID=60517 RepID=A0A0R3W4U1_TAEAS